MLVYWMYSRAHVQETDNWMDLPNKAISFVVHNKHKLQLVLLRCYSTPGPQVVS